jgi:hypothetical protein
MDRKVRSARAIADNLAVLTVPTFKALTGVLGSLADNQV